MRNVNKKNPDNSQTPITNKDGSFANISLNELQALLTEKYHLNAHLILHPRITNLTEQILYLFNTFHPKSLQKKSLDDIVNQLFICNSSNGLSFILTITTLQETEENETDTSEYTYQLEANNTLLRVHRHLVDEEEIETSSVLYDSFGKVLADSKLSKQKQKERE